MNTLTQREVLRQAGDRLQSRGRRREIFSLSDGVRVVAEFRWPGRVIVWRYADGAELVRSKPGRPLDVEVILHVAA